MLHDTLTTLTKGHQIAFLDPDYKEQILRNGGGGHGQSVRQLLRAYKTGDASAGDNWINECMQTGIATGFLTFANCQCYHAVGDGKRFGQPGEEVLQLALWSPDCNYGMMLPGKATDSV